MKLELARSVMRMNEENHKYIMEHLTPERLDKVLCKLSGSTLKQIREILEYESPEPVSVKIDAIDAKSFEKVLSRRPGKI